METIPEFRRDVLVSIRPIYASRIMKGQKTVELRRRFPESGATGATALIYSSSPVRAVVGCARIKLVLKLPISKIWKDHNEAACVTKDEFDKYFDGLTVGFAILFESVKSFKWELKAAHLEEKFGLVPPQSYRYVTEECIALLTNEQFQISNRHKHSDRAGGRSTRSGASC